MLYFWFVIQFLPKQFDHRKIAGRTLIGAAFVLFMRWMKDLMQLNKGR